ncbi:hypothetical protein ACTD5D_31805 [Nocardia takedensis]|uniref:hypothetical protein n=1 Tax=Nocardia takedensis TaxID=259390 RepID=UPI003F7595E5
MAGGIWAPDPRGTCNDLCGQLGADLVARLLAVGAADLPPLDWFPRGPRHLRGHADMPEALAWAAALGLGDPVDRGDGTHICRGDTAELGVVEIWWISDEHRWNARCTAALAAAQ